VKLQEPYTFQRSWDYVLWLLSRQAYTKRQLTEKLLKKKSTAEIIEQVMDKLESMGFIDDARYAEQYVHSRQHKTGTLKLKQELFQKGVDEATVTQTLGEVSEDQQLAAATLLLEKQRSKLQKTESHKVFAKAYAFLARRGFSGDIIREVLEHSKLKEDSN
jgi:regulatory protein